MADFKGTEKDQVAYVFGKIVEAKKWEDRAAGAGVWASAGDALHKTFHAIEKYIEGTEKDKDFSKLSKWMVTIGIGGGAAAKALQDFYKWRAAANTPSKAESDLASKFMPSNYADIVELLITGQNKNIIVMTGTLFNNIDNAGKEFNKVYDAIKDKVKDPDKEAIETIKGSYNTNFGKAVTPSNTFMTNKAIYESTDTKVTLEQKTLAMSNINTAYKEGQKISIDITGNLNDIHSLQSAPDNRTKGKALYEAAQEAYMAIATAWTNATTTIKITEEIKKAAADAAKAKAEAAGKEANKSPIEWKNATGYYWNSYLNANRNAMNDLKTADRALVDNPLTDAITELEKAIKKNSKPPAQQ